MGERHLRFKGKQWVFFRRWPKALRKAKGEYLTCNLGTADLVEARLLRDRLVAEMNLEARTADQRDADLLQDYLRASPDERETLEIIYDAEADASWQEVARQVGDRLDISRPETLKAREEAGRWYKKVTGQVVPLELNFERWLSESDVTEGTKQARRTALKRFMDWSKIETVEEVDRQLAGRYVSHLVALGLAPQTVNGRISYLATYWAWMRKRGIVETSPWEQQQLSGKTVIKRAAWTTEEIREIASKASTRMLQHLAWFAPLTGMRASEIAALKVADVRSGIMIVQSGKTESARRRVPVHSQLRNIVEERRACSNDLLFPEFHGLGKNVTKHFGRFLDRIYPERRVGRQATKTFHSYRHWTNSELLREAVPPHVVQQIMSLVSIDLIRMRPSP